MQSAPGLVAHTYTRYALTTHICRKRAARTHVPNLCIYVLRTPSDRTLRPDEARAHSLSATNTTADATDFLCPMFSERFVQRKRHIWYLFIAAKKKQLNANVRIRIDRDAQKALTESKIALH